VDNKVWCFLEGFALGLRIFDPVNASLAVPANLCPSPQVLNSPAAHRKRKTRRPVENPQEQKFHVKFLVNAFAE